MNSPAPSAARLRVLHVITHVGLGGAERVALDLIDGFGSEHDVSIFAVRGIEQGRIGIDWARELVEKLVPIHAGTRWPLKSGGLTFASLRLARVIRRTRPDIVHLHTEIPEATCAGALALLPRGAPPRLVRTIHNSIYWHYWPRIGRWCDRRCDRALIACVSGDALAAFETLRAASGAEAPPVPPRVIFNGVRMPDSTVRVPAGNRNKLRGLFAGRFEFQKGADLLPEIVRRTRTPEGLTLEFEIRGGGRHAPALRALANQPPPQWNITTGEPVPNLRDSIGGFDFVLIPSRFEGLSLLGVEAALAGVPVIGTDAPGLREVLPDGHPWLGRAGDAVSIAAALGNALRSRETWPTVIAEAQAFARQRFSFDRMISGYRALYGVST